MQILFSVCVEVPVHQAHYNSILNCAAQVLMMNKDAEANNFTDLLSVDTDLTMFTIQNLTLVKRKQIVMMSIVLKRKVATELLTTYLHFAAIEQLANAKIDKSNVAVARLFFKLSMD